MGGVTPRRAHTGSEHDHEQVDVAPVVAMAGTQGPNRRSAEYRLTARRLAVATASQRDRMRRGEGPAVLHS